ncbi:exopolysaccharide biosynthesis protein [Anaerobacterium chartisolvens]|uniref:Exopolysaccharide biosynthesis protein n=1 Tax=Anaerobacterium chartisolvens TaxID=1297424 RepID=A0A369BBK6_9FIRM|nr:phosphodiester glycosidase family protein [Anaerobacterium chartisolvens]RCX17946.1 exopolysaccharide biosynthesis protein [Anaerobacterium chartisolvens]
MFRLVTDIVGRRIAKKGFWKTAALFFLFQMLFVSMTLPAIIFLGPFDNIKSIAVGASHRTLSHQYIARLFLSDEAINEILRENTVWDYGFGEEKIQVLRFDSKRSDKIEVYNIKGIDFNGKLMVVHDPARIAAAYSDKLPEAGQTVSALAKENNAVGAINAGGFQDNSLTGTGGSPMGFIISGGRVIYSQLESEKERIDTAAFTKDGMLIVGKHSLEQLKEYGVKEAVSFGPPLIVNGKPSISQGDGGWGIAPRTAIGQRETGEVLLLTVDGRSASTFGATLRDIQDILLTYGAVNAVNLDGGSSTTMFFNGRVINTPSDRLGERAVPSAFIVTWGEGYDR